MNTGLVIYAHAGRCEVQSGSQRVICLLRGRLKREKRLTDLLVAGDRVRWRLTGPGHGIIEEILPRDTQLSRPRPGLSISEDLIVANPDQAVFVFSVRQPEPNLRLLDRFLVAAEINELPAVICANKVDLLDRGEDPHELFGLYESIGYAVIYTSAVSGQGVAALRDRLRGKLSVLTGPSGAGKTSLLNAVQPELGLVTGRISHATGKGRHTTVAVRLFPLDTGGYVADTPGLREMGLWQIEPDELDWLFPEMRPFLGKCRFSSCTHLHEPGCAIQAAVEAGAVSEARYESYCRLRVG
ncbi:MAG: ribosome small subunit-dependent GTPase A [Anaerolineae bacterium]|nr:ribosome small subunit-dependent GTPase A [Anaerolineae bacterium]